MHRVLGPMLIILILLGPGPGTLGGAERPEPSDAPSRLLAVVDEGGLPRLRAAVDFEVAESRSKRSRPGPPGLLLALLIAALCGAARERPTGRRTKPLPALYDGPRSRRGPPGLVRFA